MGYENQGWNDPRLQQNSSGNEGSWFMKLSPLVRVRIVGPAVVFEKHWTKNRLNEDVIVRCPGKDVCPICSVTEKPRVRALLPVIERLPNTPPQCKILEVPKVVAKQLKNLQEGSWGDLSRYDVEIMQQKKGKRTEYQVTPQPLVQLSPAEQAEIQRFFELVDYRQFAVAHTVEEIMKIMNGQPAQGAQAPQQTYAPQYAPQYTPQYAPSAPQQPAPPAQLYIPPQPLPLPAPVYAAQYQAPQNPQPQYAPPVVQPQQPTQQPAPPQAQPAPQAQLAPVYVPPPAAPGPTPGVVVSDGTFAKYMPTNIPNKV